MTFGLIGKFTAHAGQRDVLVRVLLEAADLLQRNPDCLHYVVSTSDEPDAVWPLIAGISDRTELSIQGGKGIPS